MTRNRNIRWISLALCLLMTVCLFASCGKSDNAMAEDKEMEYVGNSSGTSKPGIKEDPAETGDGVADNGTNGEALAVKIIRTASISAETKEFDSALGEIEANVSALGGYIESNQISGQNYASAQNGKRNRYASMTLRIPAERLDEFLEKTGTLVNVISSSSTAEDVSGQYYDIEARLAVLETERLVLERMLSGSESLEHMITVEERLYDVIYEIESYKTQLKVYDSKIAYSTVRLNLSEVADLTVVAEDNSFGARFKQAVGESWQNFVEFCKEFVIWLVYALPTLIILGIVGTAVAVVTVKTVKKRRKKAEEKGTEDKE